MTQKVCLHAILFFCMMSVAIGSQAEFNIDVKKGFYLRSFGVKCDGISDDSLAINAAIAKVREKSGASGGEPAKILFPSGVCVTSKALDFTELKAKGNIVAGSGTKILANLSRGVVFDALGSQYLTIKDLTIVTASGSDPDVGLLIGRSKATALESSDNIFLQSVNIIGSFRLAALMNENAETSLFEKLVIVNTSTSTASYAVVEDGLNHFGVKSEFLASSQEANVPESFNENTFLNCDIRHNGLGVPVWVANTSRLSFIRSYFAALHNETAMVLFSHSASDRNTLLNVDAHFETGVLKRDFLISGENRSPRLFGFSYEDQHPNGSAYVFGVDPGINAVVADGASIKIDSLPQNAVLFERPNIWRVSGNVTLGGGSAWNLPASQFNGNLINGD